MKTHWSENAGWQFIGVVLSALGILISLLPEKQRLLGFIISMVGMIVLAWVLLKKPVKRITRQLTPRNVCRLTHKFAKRGRYVSEEQKGEDMRQIPARLR